MKLQEKVKIALDETRILILGAQILLGFGFRGAFSEGFDELPAYARYAGWGWAGAPRLRRRLC